MKQAGALVEFPEMPGHHWPAPSSLAEGMAGAGNVFPILVLYFRDSWGFYICGGTARRSETLPFVSLTNRLCVWAWLPLLWGIP